MVLNSQGIRCYVDWNLLAASKVCWYWVGISWWAVNLLRMRKNARVQSFYHEPLLKEEQHGFCAGNSGPLKLPLSVFIAQSLLGLWVCASSRIQTRACWSRGQLCGSRRPNMLAVAGSVGCDAVFCQQLIFCGRDFSFSTVAEPGVFVEG